MMKGTARFVRGKTSRVEHQQLSALGQNKTTALYDRISGCTFIADIHNEYMFAMV